nr:retrovirus-related Pol polyprotein from transposon TNT 1-94 [Tanacetum cinerariifolium]
MAVVEVPQMLNLRKPENQWIRDEKKAANLDQRLKSLIISVLRDDQMNSVMNYLTDKSTCPDDEEDTRSIHEYLNDLEEEYQARALLSKSKRFFKKAKYNKVKAKLALMSSSASASKASMVKNKGLIAEAYEWDEEEVSSDDNKMVEINVLMALAEENDAVSEEGARNGE